MSTVSLGAYDGVAKWFERSGGLPKALALYSTQDELCCAEGKCLSKKPALGRLLTEGPALHHLKLECFDIDCLQNWIAVAQAPDNRGWNSLGSLHLLFKEGDWNHIQDLAHSTFRYLPPVTALHVELPTALLPFGPDGDLDFLGMPAPPILQHLTTFIVGCDCSGILALGVLKYCTMLETLEVEVCGKTVPWLEEEQGEAELSTFINLNTLRIRGAPHIGFLSRTKTPNLRHLKCSLSYYGDQWDISFPQIFEEFIQHSRLEHKLSFLRLQGVRITGQGLAYALDRLRNLRHLTLDQVKLSEPDGSWRELWAQ